MVVEDTNDIKPLSELPHFTCFVKQPEPITGSFYALGLNGWILDIISGRKENHTPYPILEPLGYFEAWQRSATLFLDDHFGNERITVAGKNVAGFDIPFLPKCLQARFRHRVIDPGTLFTDWENDKCIPDLGKCKERAGLEATVAHDTYDDAIDVIRLLRTKYAVPVKDDGDIIKP